MSAAQHTPGPWEANGPFVNSAAVIGIADCSRAAVAENWAGTDYATDEIAEANARLIAAAPELLNSLILMVRTHDEPAETLLQETKEMLWLEQARAVIAKATGQEGGAK
ncbi:hypothetical protein [Variovorax paradoxus]|uniref:hypothetical protein n=1 Tax=Variovorax paradoxus TaxID=34073 RepID=UPI00193152F9|nr:hypothetical protein INQ48_18170 [Variovorax paradoxus]